MRFLYEVLVRGGPEGLVGAHEIWGTEDGGVIRLDPPTPLATADVAQLVGAGFVTLSADYAAAQARIAELERLVDAPGRAAPALPFLDFMALFTGVEQAALVNSDDTQVKLFLLEASGAGELHLASDRVAAALDYLVAKGLIAPARKADIIAGKTPA